MAGWRRSEEVWRERLARLAEDLDETQRASEREKRQSRARVRMVGGK